jgi:hypothetical protein
MKDVELSIVKRENEIDICKKDIIPKIEVPLRPR